MKISLMAATPTRRQLWLSWMLVVGAPLSVLAGEATGVASARVIAPLSIAATQTHLRFGSFSTRSGGDTVTVRPDGGRVLAGAAAGSEGAGDFGPARFIVRGEDGLSYSIGVPQETELTTGSGGAQERMQISGFSTEPAGRGLLRDGAQELLLGATITTVAGQALGTYTGHFKLTVSYD